MLIITIQATELNTMSTRDTVLFCEWKEFTEDNLKEMITDLRLRASDCLDYFMEMR